MLVDIDPNLFISCSRNLLERRSNQPNVPFVKPKRIVLRSPDVVERDDMGTWKEMFCIWRLSMQQTVSLQLRAAKTYLPKGARSDTGAGASMPGSVNEGRARTDVALFNERA